MDEQMIKMEHPDLPGTAPAIASLEAFETVWKAKGFRLCKESAATVKAAKAKPQSKPEPKSEPEPENSRAASDSEEGKDE